MKLTSQQIQQLYKFTRQHFVEHYDVQTELVDHLANNIEQIWQEQPNLSFEQARDISFKKFGVFGFMGVVEARQKALSKKYWKLIWNIFKAYFKIPQVLTTLMIFTCFYMSFNMVQNHKWIYLSVGVGVVIVAGFRFYKLNKLKKRRFELTNKKWLLEDYVLNAGNMGIFGQLMIQIVVSFKAQLTNEYSIVLVSAFITCYLMMLYIIAYVLPNNVEEILEKQYPEYKLV